MNKIIRYSIPSLWCGLGFYRGFKSYDKEASKCSKDFLKSICYGFCGLFIYINPFSLPLIINNEYKMLKQNWHKSNNS